MGSILRFLSSYLRLEPGEFVNLSFLYFATFVMRAAAFAGVAVMQHVMFPDTRDAFWKGLLFAVYPLAEIATVGYFGTLCDRIGRKRILLLAHLVTAGAVFLFIPSLGVPAGIRPYLVAVFFAMFGIGAAAKVASTLAMINDHSSLSNRAQLMSFFDLVTFGGLVGGFGAGFLALNAFGTDPALVLLVGGLGVTASVALVYFLVRETPFVREQRGTWDLLRAVLANPDIRRLLPVYIPVVALYGYVISFTDKLIGVQTGAAQVGKLIVVVLAIGAPLAASLVGGRISDRARMRRPFMALGLACFGGLAIVISFGPTVDELYGRWPLVAVMAAGAGTFPPAALAYLGDIVQHSVTGTTFGIYSIIFGSGLIVGPILGGALTSALGSLAFAVIALGLIGVAGAGLLFIREPSKFPPTLSSVEAPAPPARR